MCLDVFDTLAVPLEHVKLQPQHHLLLLLDVSLCSHVVLHIGVLS